MCNVGRVRSLGECTHGADMSSTGGVVSRENEDYMGKGAGGLALRRQAGVFLCFQWCCGLLLVSFRAPRTSR